MEKRSMDHFAGLDISVKDTSICIVDDAGKIIREVKVASEPEALFSGHIPERVLGGVGPGQEFVDAAVGMAVDDLDNNVAEIGLRIDGV